MAHFGASFWLMSNVQNYGMQPGPVRKACFYSKYDWRESASGDSPLPVLTADDKQWSLVANDSKHLQIVSVHRGQASLSKQFSLRWHFYYYLNYFKVHVKDKSNQLQHLNQVISIQMG